MPKIKKKHEQDLYGPLELIQKGVIGTGKPALILCKGEESRVSRVIDFSDRAGTLVYPYPELIDLKEKENSPNLVAGTIISVEGEVSDEEKLHLLKGIWDAKTPTFDPADERPERRYNFLPRELMPAFGEEILKDFYATRIPRLSPIYHLYTDHGKWESGLYIINLCRGWQLFKSSYQIEFIVLRYNSKLVSEQEGDTTKEFVMADIEFADQVFGLDVVAWKTSFPDKIGYKLNGTIVRMLDQEQKDSLRTQLADFVKSEICRVDRKWLLSKHFAKEDALS